jgi:predicted nuclease with RNAse H fold
MTSRKPSTLVIGIDVGGRTKGFHAVALKDGQYHDKFASTEVDQLLNWYVIGLNPSLIAVDAPCRWSITGNSRPAERELQAERIFCFSTPTREAAYSHPTNNYDWMFSGEALYERLEKTHPLCRSLPTVGAKSCFETFPHAVTWHLRDGNASAKKKRAQRRQLLELHRISTFQLTNIDWVDAAVCALTANLAATGRPMKSFGEPETGQIIVPIYPSLAEKQS